jgi:hypothetical protein
MKIEMTTVMNEHMMTIVLDQIGHWRLPDQHLLVTLMGQIVKIMTMLNVVC